MGSEQAVAPPPGEILLLQTELARPGDVLLSRGQGMESGIYAYGGGGVFSHAAIWTGSVIYEAAENGIVPVPLEDVDLEDDPDAPHQGGSRRGLKKLPAARFYMCLRHEDFSSKMTQRMVEELAASIALFTQYSDISRLAAAIAFIPKPIARWLKSVASVAEKWAGYKQPNSGPFCSELVAIFFESAGVRLFNTPRAAETVSPSCLTGSVLKEQKGVILSVPESRVQTRELNGYEKRLSERRSPDAYKIRVARHAEISVLQRQLLGLKRLQFTLADVAGGKERAQEIDAIELQLGKLWTLENDEAEAAFDDVRKLLGPDAAEFGYTEDAFTLPNMQRASIIPADGVELLEKPGRHSYVKRRLGCGDKVRTYDMGDAYCLVQCDSEDLGWIPREALAFESKSDQI